MAVSNPRRLHGLMLMVQSGIGISGGRSRCFTFWQDFQKVSPSCPLPKETMDSVRQSASERALRSCEEETSCPRYVWNLLTIDQCYRNAETPSECQLQHEDYMECLHHTKEVCLRLLSRT